MVCTYYDHFKYVAKSRQCRFCMHIINIVCVDTCPTEDNLEIDRSVETEKVRKRAKERKLRDVLGNSLYLSLVIRIT